jgi:hypothetical protein
LVFFIGFEIRAESRKINVRAVLTVRDLFLDQSVLDFREIFPMKKDRVVVSSVNTNARGLIDSRLTVVNISKEGFGEASIIHSGAFVRGGGGLMFGSQCVDDGQITGRDKVCKIVSIDVIIFLTLGANTWGVVSLANVTICIT